MMNKIVITDSAKFEEVIKSFEKSLSNIKDIFLYEKSNIEKINATSIWTGDSQKITYDKFKSLEKNFNPIEESIQLYIDFLKKTLEDYKKFEEHTDMMAADSAVQLDI